MASLIASYAHFGIERSWDTDGFVESFTCCWCKSVGSLCALFDVNSSTLLSAVENNALLRKLDPESIPRRETEECGCRSFLQERLVVELVGLAVFHLVGRRVSYQSGLDLAPLSCKWAGRHAKLLASYYIVTTDSASPDFSCRLTPSVCHWVLVEKQHKHLSLVYTLQCTVYSAKWLRRHTTSNVAPVH